MGDMAIGALDILSTLFVSVIGLVFIVLIIMLVVDLSQTRDAVFLDLPEDIAA